MPFGPLVPLLALVTVFALALAAGFVYAHEPAPPEFRTTVQPGPVSTEESVRGTITAVGPDYVDVTTAGGTRRLQAPGGVAVEELVPLVGAMTPGARVNVGGNRTENGFVITGVVVLEGAR